MITPPSTAPVVLGVQCAFTNRWLPSGIAHVASKLAACTLVTVPTTEAPLGKYSIWKAVDARLVGRSSRSARTSTRWDPVPLPDIDTIPRVTP